MKIFEQTPTYVIRLQVTKTDEQSEYLTLCETTPAEVESMCINIIEKQNLSPFLQGLRTSINIREAWGSKNGRPISLSFKGISPKKTIELIKSHIKKINNESKDGDASIEG